MDALRVRMLGTLETWRALKACVCDADARESATAGLLDDAHASQLTASACRIAAAALRWYERTETGGDDHAERQAMIAACKEATDE